MNNNQFSKCNTCGNDEKFVYIIDNVEHIGCKFGCNQKVITKDKTNPK